MPIFPNPINAKFTTDVKNYRDLLLSADANQQQLFSRCQKGARDALMAAFFDMLRAYATMDAHTAPRPATWKPLASRGRSGGVFCVPSVASATTLSTRLLVGHR